jgi:hypothetical protein
MSPKIGADFRTSRRLTCAAAGSALSIFASRPPRGNRAGRAAAADHGPVTDTETAAGSARAPEPSPIRGRRELLPGVNLRSALLVVGVLLLQLGFVLSYVGAFHDPAPRSIPVAVVAPEGASPGAVDQVVQQLDGLDGSPVDARAARDEAAGRRLLAEREVDGVLLVGAGTRDTLLVAGASGSALGTALTEVLGQVDAAQQRTLTTDDVIPAAAGDARGLSAFYLAIGWVVGGYLVASIIGVSNGSVPASRGRAAVRIGALALYAVASGLGGALVVEPLLGVFEGHLLQLWALGALVVFAVGAFTMALQVWTGLVGIGLAILVFVVLGNPSAGGAYPAPLLPPFWAGIGSWLPPGAATDAVRSIVYFGGTGVGSALLVLTGYAVVGVTGTVLGAGQRTAAAEGEVLA